MGSLYGITHHPVEIKKISLRTWSLRDEIVYKIQHQLEPNQEAGDLIKKLHLEYEPTTRAPRMNAQTNPEGLTLIDGGGQAEESKAQEASSEEAAEGE